MGSGNSGGGGGGLVAAAAAVWAVVVVAGWAAAGWVVVAALREEEVLDAWRDYRPCYRCGRWIPRRRRAARGRPVAAAAEAAASISLLRPITCKRFRAAAINYFQSLGVNLDPVANPGKALFFNDRQGMLVVRATMQDLDIIEVAIQVLNIVPPQVNIKAKFVEVSQDDNKALGFDWYLGNVLMNNGAIGGQGGTAPSFNGAAHRGQSHRDLSRRPANPVTGTPDHDRARSHGHAPDFRFAQCLVIGSSLLRGS